MPKVFLRSSLSDDAVSLSSKLFRKQLLRFGEWSHPQAPGGKLKVDEALAEAIIDNFKSGIRDNVPIPLGHDVDALSSVGQVVGMEVDDSGLWGIHEFKDESAAKKVEDGVFTGTSALIDLNYVDKETGKEFGPVLIHNAMTNAPYIKGLAPFEAVALSEDASKVTVINLDETGGGTGMDKIKELLAQIKDLSDEDVQKALAEARPKLFESEETDEEDEEKALAEAKAEGQKELVAALAEKGVTVSLSEGKPKDKGKADDSVDISKHPDFVSLSEQVGTLAEAKRKQDAESTIDAAIKEGKILPKQREGFLTVALAEGGDEMLKALIPEKSIVDLSEHGANLPRDSVVELSEDEAESEVKRYAGLLGNKKEDK